MTMTLMQVWGVLLILILCPILGGLPLIAWLTSALTGRQLAQLGTGNIGVQAAFYHGGRLVGILAVVSEALKGIAAVLLARAFFPMGSIWELVALIALVAGRYAIGRGAGTTNVVWGIIAHDWKVALLIFVIGGIGFTILRDRSSGRLAVLILLPLMIALLHPHDGGRVIAGTILSIVIAWIYQKIPDDLDLPPEQVNSESQAVFRFFQGDKAVVSLAQPLEAEKVGQKSATLSQLKRWGYPVPNGWVIPPGDDPAPLIEAVQPSVGKPLVVRSSAIGEDSEQASAAGQYQSILNVTSKVALQEAINQCVTSYDEPTAVQYRRDRNLPDQAIAVLVQEQIPGVFGGVAFSRDPISRHGDAVVIEALPGNVSRVVSGQVTPEQYQVFISDTEILDSNSSWVIPDHLNLEVLGSGDIPPRLIQQVAFLARHLEVRFHGIPQDIEWIYDGQTLWLLQARPITTLIPIWTRKIAAEVIPGLIRPLTWSINRPLTCGVWGEIFTIVLAQRASGLDFNQTATLHYSRAYFNATLLGQIFIRMGLPPESLEFLTRGAKFSKPPLQSTLQNLPGLLRLFQRELSLEKNFTKDYQRIFNPIISQLKQQSASELSASDLLQRIEQILAVLKRATYYSIFAPLSVAIRQAIFKVPESELNYSLTPEIASMRSLQQLADDVHIALPKINLEGIDRGTDLFSLLAETPDGQNILEWFNQWLERYGYLSEVGTDIAVPTWKENPAPIQDTFAQLVKEAQGKNLASQTHQKLTKRNRALQNRLDLKGKVTEIYSYLLAELRWSFVALENHWLSSGLLTQTGDIFFLELPEISSLVVESDRALINRLNQLIEQRRSQLAQDQKIAIIPALVYGNAPPINLKPQTRKAQSKIQGIGASPGQIEGRIKIIRNLQTMPEINRDTILVVPYTDSAWAPLLARAGGLISEVGGRLSHGAIVAREYGIPAVMDIDNATQIFQDGQWVSIDGQQGIVEIF